MKKWRVGGGIAASTYVGEFEAATWQEAIEAAYKVAGVSVCHECAKHISDPEIDHLWAEDEETGDCTSEPTLGDQVSEQAREIERLRRKCDRLSDFLADARAKAETYEKDWYAAKSEFGTAIAKLREQHRSEVRVLKQQLDCTYGDTPGLIHCPPDKPCAMHEAERRQRERARDAIAKARGQE
jgi:hypothetical protein